MRLSSSKGKIVLAATIMASGMGFLMSSAVNIALPVIQSAFNTGFSNIQWIVNAYTLALSSLILLTGSLGDRYGKRKIFSLGILIFTIAALLSGLSPNLPVLIGLQVLQGLGAAFMVPGSLAIITSLFEEKGKVIGLWAGISGGIAALGPLVGGYLASFSWRYVYFSMVPLGILTLLASLKVPEFETRDAKIDILGAVLVVSGLFGLSFGLIRSSRAGWLDPLTITPVVAGIAALLVFWFTEKRTRHPLVPLQLFKDTKILGANIHTLFLYLTFNAILFFMTFNLQQLQGMSSTTAGMYLLPTTLIITFFAGASGSYTDKHGVRRQMVLGPLGVAAGITILLLAGRDASYWTTFFPGLVLLGAGMVFAIPALTKAALDVDEKQSGAASGLNNAVARVSGLVAVALLGSIFSTVFAWQLGYGLENIDITEGHRSAILEQSDKLLEIDVPDTVQNSVRSVMEHSFVFAYRISLILAGIAALLSSVTAWFMIDPY